MSLQYSVALVGDYDSSVPAHQAIPPALDLASAHHGTRIHATWVPTAAIQRAEVDLESYQGIWCVPASPYKNTQGALSAIRFAREQKLPFLGTCGGFQHALLEYAQNVLGMVEAAHAEINPEGSQLLIAPLSCSLIETQAELLLKPDSILSKSYGTRRIVEGYRCSYGPTLNTKTHCLLAIFGSQRAVWKGRCALEKSRATHFLWVRSFNQNGVLSRGNCHRSFENLQGLSLETRAVLRK
jgi:CTP synthase (UTP-ammonia lyase)